MSDSATPVTQVEGTFRASDGFELHTYTWSSREIDARPGPTVVFMHGYAEHVGRYREFAEHLVRAGNRVSGFDARGHGKSPGQRGHIDDFERYVEDLHEYTQWIRHKAPEQPLILLGHSNGGLAALRLAQSRRHVLDGLILSSPLIALQPKHQVVPMWLAIIIDALASRLPLPNGIDGGELTHDPEIRRLQENDPLAHGRTTPRWFVTVNQTMARAGSNFESVRLPVLVLQADSDPIVVPQAIGQMFQRFASPDKELVVVRNSYHELLNEVGRHETYRQIASWLGKRWKASAAA